MIKKIAVILSVLNLVFFTSPAMATSGSNHGLRQFKIPDSAVQVSDNVYSLGTAKDPKTSKNVEGFAIVHYKDNDAARSISAKVKINKKTASCYGFLSPGAKWKTLEPWVVNPTNSRGLTSDFILNNLSGNIAKWEDAADGIVGNGSGVNILGDGSTTSADLSLGAGTLNGANEVYFADVNISGAIAVSTIWGIWGGDVSTREIVEWDQVYDDVDFDWSSSGEPNKMDFENISTHELGHATGMADLYQTACSEQTMYGYAAYGETRKSTLENGDIKGIDLLY